jgi:hypothetical protein
MIVDDRGRAVSKLVRYHSKRSPRDDEMILDDRGAVSSREKRIRRQAKAEIRPVRRPIIRNNPGLYTNERI